MALTFARNAVSVSGGTTGAPETWDDVEVVGIHVPSGSRYGFCDLAFPEAKGFDSLPALGQVVRVAVGGTTIFQGHSVAFPGAVSLNDDRQMLRAVDPRWLLGKVRVGDTALTPSGGGGFPVVGYRVMFNPEGRRNRSADPDEGLYTFDEGSDAAYWTRKQILELLLATYASGILEVDTETLSAKWDEITYNFIPYTMPLNTVISQLAGECGESWGIAPQSEGAAEYVPIVPGGGEAFTVSLAYGDTKTAAAVNSVMQARGEVSIEHASDVVEVHTGSTYVETTYSTEESAEEAGDAMLTAFDPDDRSRYVKGFRADVTKYAANSLGRNLSAGAKPKPWLRSLITRVNASGDYIDPGAAETVGAGRRMVPEECVWIEYDSERRKVLSGFEIHMDAAEILFDGILGLETNFRGEVEEVTLFEGPEKVWLTVVTEVEEIDGQRQTATAHVSGATLTELVWRSDLHPLVRINSDLPEPSNTITTAADGTAEVYRDYTTELGNLATDLLASQSSAEVNVNFTTLDLTTSVALGRKVTFLSTDCAIVDVYFDLREGMDMLQVRATSNLSRAIF